MNDKKFRKCACGAMSVYLVPQRCFCGRKDDGCEHCMPNGRCPECPPLPVCPKCKSEDLGSMSWDDVYKFEIHNELTCRNCGYRWDIVVPFNDGDIELAKKRQQGQQHLTGKKTIH